VQRVRVAPMPSSAFIPAIVASITDVVAAVIVQASQHNLPGRFLIFEVAMFGLALLLATRYRWVWGVGFVLLIGGVLPTGASVGMFYVPTVIAAGWVMVKRLDAASETPPASFLDTIPKGA
jgi:hypothetical protein